MRFLKLLHQQEKLFQLKRFNHSINQKSINQKSINQKSIPQK